MLDIEQNRVDVEMKGVAPAIRGRFSVIVPVFNSRKYLHACLDSLIAAIDRYGNAELIVLDNGSTDGSYEIVQAEYHQARLCQVTGVNVGGLRNHGAELATGEYLAFIDSDCVLTKDYFQEALKVFSCVEADATGSMCTLPETANWIERTWRALHGRNRDGYVNYLNSGNLIVKRASFALVGGFDSNLVTGEDAELAERLRSAGSKIYECRSVSAVHLGIPGTLGQFARRQAWYGQGAFHNLRSWKPVTTILLYPIFVTIGCLSLYFTPASLIVRLGIALMLINAIPALAVGYRLSRLGRVFYPFHALFLYHCFYAARFFGLARALVGSAARTYSKAG